MKKLRDPPRCGAAIRQAEAERGPTLCAPPTPHMQNNGDESLALPRMHALGYALRRRATPLSLRARKR